MTDRPARRSRTHRSAGTSAGAASRCGGAGSTPGCAGWRCARRRTSGTAGGTRSIITSTSRPRCSSQGRPSRAPARARGVDEVLGVGRHRLGAELADEAHQTGDQAGQLGELPDVATVPAEPHVRVGAVELGGGAGRRRRGRWSGGSDPPPRRPLHPPVEHRLVPGGQLLGHEAAQAAERRSVSTCGASATGSSWAHHWTIDGWWPSESTASRPGARPPCGSGGRSPTATGSLPAAARRARRRRGRARGRRCGPARAACSVRPRRRARRRADIRPTGVGQARAVSGGRLAPFMNSRSPLIEQTQSFPRHLAKPVRRDRRSLSSPSTRSSTSMSVSGWSPSARRRHSCVGRRPATTRFRDAAGQRVLGSPTTRRPPRSAGARSERRRCRGGCAAAGGRGLVGVAQARGGGRA